MTDVDEALKELRPTYADFDITSQVWFMSSVPYAGGGFADVRIATRLSFWWTVRYIASIATLGFVTCEAAEQVAVKILRPPPTFKPDVTILRRLRQEISIWRRLEHPNVQPLSGLWWPQQELIPAMVSTWETNGNLTSYLPQLSTPGDRVTMDILSGLMYLHGRDVIHADLKGENVLISPEGKPLLCDFGVAWTCVKISVSFTMARQPGQGTLRYMAPELLFEETPKDTSCYTPASDIWAFGCLAFLVLAGIEPYSNKSRFPTIIHALMMHEFFPRPADLDNSQWALVLSCCSFSADERAKSDFVCEQLCVQQLLLRKDLPPQAQTFRKEYRITLQISEDTVEQEHEQDPQAKAHEESAETRSKVVGDMKQATNNLIDKLRAESLDCFLDTSYVEESRP